MNKRFLASVLLFGCLAVVSLPQSAEARATNTSRNAANNSGGNNSGSNSNNGNNGGNGNNNGGNNNGGGNNPGLLAVCGVTDVTLGGGSANACFGQVAGNDVGNNPNEPNLLELLNDPLAPPNFVITGNWLSAGTQIADDSGTNGVFTSLANSGLLTGNWSLALNNTALIEALVISVKGGNGWSAYFFNPSTLANSFSGSWSTLGLLNGGNQQPGISHISAYYVLGQTPPTPIPTPALLPGLIGMGLAAMRKRKQEQEQAQNA